MKRNYFVLLSSLVFSLIAAPLCAQIGMGGQPHPSAALDVKSTNKAFYPPRITNLQRGNMLDPQPGAIVFDATKRALYYFDGVNWLALSATLSSNLNPLEFMAESPADDDFFGTSVESGENYAIVGVRNDDVGANVDQGSAYVYVRSGKTWTQQAQLTDSFGSAGSLFGTSVATDDEYALVGSPGDNTNRGSAQVFIRNGTNWSIQDRITASDGVAGDSFGSSVGLVSNLAIVGSPSDDVGSQADQGSAHIFRRSGSNWVLQTKLTASDGGGAGDRFGLSVGISFNGSLTATLVGAPNNDNGTATNQGAAYAFHWSGAAWFPRGKLVANDGAAGDFFGSSIVVNGAQAIVGAPNDDINANGNQGSAYIFGWTGTAWTQRAKLTASDGAANDFFGKSVSISGEWAIVGAPGKDLNGKEDVGSVYIFRFVNSVWQPFRQLSGNEREDTANGSSVDIFGDGDIPFVIGAPGFSIRKGKIAFGSVE